MIQRALQLSLLTLLTAAALMAQGNEAQLNQRQAKALNSYAKRAFDKGFPRIAKIVWLKTIKLYDPDNKAAWTALGYVKNGSSWVLDPKRPYPTKDTGKGSDGKPLESKYRALEKALANTHRNAAKKYAKADRQDLALKHWQMVLRWVKNDSEAAAALEHKEIDGLTGTDLEKTLYDRSKMVEKTIEAQSKIDYPTETVTGIKCDPLDRAQVPYITVTSDHFTLHGAPDQEENLHKSLNWAERALEVCKAAFPWSYSDSKWPLEWACVANKDTFKQTLRANKVSDLEWKMENTATSMIGKTKIATTAGIQTMFDSCVRNVARGYSGFASDGFGEGIGHTFVGMMFNNNRLFSVDRKKQEGTSASEEDLEFKSPDFDVWKTLSLEMAWKSTGGVPANALPFCDASNFTNEERIKAWSFTDYVMRRDPELLRTMDAIAQEMKKRRAKQPLDFEKQFTEKHPDVTIPQLEKEWEDFWTEASPVLKAIRNNTPPVSAISKGVDKWLIALNTQRKKFGRAPVTWSANFSARCKDHAQYLKENKKERGPAAEHTQKVDLGGSYSTSLFAQMAVVEIGAKVSKAKKVFEQWVNIPGYRDLFINHTILSIGMFVEGDILVINATSGIGPPKDKSSGFDCYPPRNDTGLTFDRAVPVALLGPEAEKILADNGRAGQKTIGFPLTMHFGNTGGVHLRGNLSCTITGRDGTKIEGVLVYDDGEIRTTSAPGMVTFWALDPLPKGAITFTWNWKQNGETSKATGRFTAK